MSDAGSDSPSTAAPVRPLPARVPSTLGAR